MIRNQSFSRIAFVAIAVTLGFIGTNAAMVFAGNCVRLELFVRSDSPQSQKAVEYIERLEARWPGLAVEVKDVLNDKTALARAHQLIKDYKIEKPGVPLFHASRQLIVGFRDENTTGKKIENLLTIRVYTRDGCPHCADGKRFLASMKQKYPGFRIQIYEITRDANARNELQDLARRHNILAPSVPTFHFCGEVIVGFISDATTGVRIENLLKQSSVICPADGESAAIPLAPFAHWMMQSTSLTAHSNQKDAESPPSTDEADPLEEFSLEEIPLEELPPTDNQQPAVAIPPEDPPSSIDLPVFGTVTMERIGLPLFTLAVGLVDGFNPCAMWVLLFLLSILVNLKDRRKILAVAGTFDLISGLAYFAFMAAWLNVFLFVGYLRSAQMTLGVLATFVGIVHIKDFFAHGRGLSFSIPESAKPGLYARVRKIVTAEHLLGAILGAAILAVLVNVIELLCTAGLPALYTQILTLRNLPPWQNYAYLGLYNVAYMFDDSLMVAVVVITLGRRKLQERQGRWLKLISGLVIVALGLVLLFKPEWLI
jgi:glutaredoxin